MLGCPTYSFYRFCIAANNQITGTIPAEFGVDQEIIRIDFGNNQIRGPIPPEFFQQLPGVELLSLNDNALTGTVPATVAAMELLEELYLDGNPLTGILPESISALGNLKMIDISATNITGNVEAALCIGGKEWNVLRADCLDDSSSASCATECCHKDGYCCDMTGQTACEVPKTP